MPLDPNVISSKVMNRRHAACRESMADAGAGGSGENNPMTERGGAGEWRTKPVYRDALLAATRVSPLGGETGCVTPGGVASGLHLQSR